MAEEKEIEEVNPVLYIGQDLGYFENLTSKLSSLYPDTPWSFESCEDFQNLDPHQQFLEITRRPPSIIFLDFSKQRDQIVRLAKLLRNESNCRLISTIGLHDYLTKEHEIDVAIMCGLRINHIKSAEISDVIYDAIMFFNPEIVKKEDLALARFGEEFELHTDIKLSYATKNRFEVETNIAFEEGEILELEQNPLSLYLKSPKFHVKNKRDYNLRHSSRYAFDFEYHYMPGYQPDKEFEDRGKQKELQAIQNEIDDWVDTKFNEERTNYAKVLIVDKEMDLFKCIDRPIFEYPFYIDLQGQFNRGLLSLKRRRPEVIAMVYSEPAPTDEPEEPGMIGTGAREIKPPTEDEMDDIFRYNNLRAIAVLCKTIAKIENYDPIIVLFKSPFKSEELQSDLDFKKIIAYPGPTNLEIIENFTKVVTLHKNNQLNATLKKELEQLKQKDPKTYNGKTEQDIREKKVIFESLDHKTLVQTYFYASTLAITERTIFFTSNREIPPYTVLKTKFPIPMHITTFPLEENHELAKTPNAYQGLINCVGEQDKKELRMFINRILGTEKDEKEKAEIEEFKKKNAEAAKAKELADAEALAEQEALENSQDSDPDKEAS